jgi:hypothetical protein
MFILNSIYLKSNFINLLTEEVKKNSINFSSFYHIHLSISYESHSDSIE